jgi:radical SAM protein with 4Fe4S-binding SPASM domain
MRNPLIKPANAVIAGYSYFQSSVRGKTIAHGMPLAAGVELTNYCNLNCPECNSGSGLMTRERGFMSLDLFDRIISELGSYIYNINLYFQGESMLHPQFFSILRKCRKINSTLSTNGHFLSAENAENLVRSGLGKLIVSLDGMDRSAYSSYRINGDFEKVVAGIKNVSEARGRISSHMKLAIQFLVNRNNEHQIPAARKFAREMKASFHLKSMQIINKDSYGSWLPSLGKFSRYEKTDNGYTLKNPFPNKCSRLWFNPVITWDGKVLPCCFDKNADHVMGDLNEDPFTEIWNDPRYKMFRRSVLSDRKIIEICRNCTSGLKLKLS